MCFLYQTFSPTHREDKKKIMHAHKRFFLHVANRRRHFSDNREPAEMERLGTCVLSVEKLFNRCRQLRDILEPFDQISLEGEDVSEVPHQPQLRFL